MLFPNYLGTLVLLTVTTNRGGPISSVY